VLCLAGPTASGKSAASLRLAQVRPIEIISVDSALVYRGMDIGTAKPTAAEQALVPHHLIDIRDPRQAYSAAEFARDATALIEDISARGRLPVLTGGTMLYFKALLEGLSTLPAAQPALRAEIEARARTEGWPALHAELARVDAVTAARLAPQDSQRIQRALEVYQVTGQAMSSLYAQAPTGGLRAGDALLVSLEPDERSWLHARIARRFADMLDAGLLAEVQALQARGDLNRDMPAMRCVGYRQTWDALAGDFPLAELCARGVFATRQLAKRQLTWLRGMPQRWRIPCDAPQALDQLLRHVEQAFSPPSP
jgi:tRNA dimethylallyltransferase